MPPDSADKRAAAAAKPKPRASIYDAMLIVAFVALVIGCVVLYLEWAAYPTTKASWLDRAGAPATVVLAQADICGDAARLT